MAANVWKNSLKNVESDNNNILYETLLDFFLQRNGTYFLNKPHIMGVSGLIIRRGNSSLSEPQFTELSAVACQSVSHFPTFCRKQHDFVKKESLDIKSLF